MFMGIEISTVLGHVHFQICCVFLDMCHRCRNVSCFWSCSFVGGIKKNLGSLSIVALSSLSLSLSPSLFSFLFSLLPLSFFRFLMSLVSCHFSFCFFSLLHLSFLFTSGFLSSWWTQGLYLQHVQTSSTRVLMSSSNRYSPFVNMVDSLVVHIQLCNLWRTSFSVLVLMFLCFCLYFVSINPEDDDVILRGNMLRESVCANTSVIILFFNVVGSFFCTLCVP